MVAACSTALQLVPSVDETHAGTASNCEADLEQSGRLHRRRTEGAQKKLGSLRPQRLHRLLPEGDSGGESLLMLQPRCVDVAAIGQIYDTKAQKSGFCCYTLAFVNISSMCWVF